VNFDFKNGHMTNNQNSIQFDINQVAFWHELCHFHSVAGWLLSVVGFAANCGLAVIDSQPKLSASVGHSLSVYCWWRHVYCS